MAEITFESGGEPYPEGTAWREMTQYEHDIVSRLVSFVPERLRPFVPSFVRTMDECGCLEFDGVDESQPVRVLVEAALPAGHEMYPLEVTLSTRGQVACWLEFHRFGKANAYRPPATAFCASPHFDGP